MTDAEKNEKALKSKGGRLERRSTVAWAKRRFNKTITAQEVVEWVNSRQKRYGDKPGGL